MVDEMFCVEQGALEHMGKLMFCVEPEALEHMNTYICVEQEAHEFCLTMGTIFFLFLTGFYLFLVMDFYRMFKTCKTLHLKLSNKQQKLHIL